MERYEIWQAKVKFEESDGIKERPVNDMERPDFPCRL